MDEFSRWFNVHSLNAGPFYTLAWVPLLKILLITLYFPKSWSQTNSLTCLCAVSGIVCCQWIGGRERRTVPQLQFDTVLAVLVNEIRHNT